MVYSMERGTTAPDNQTNWLSYIATVDTLSMLVDLVSQGYKIRLLIIVTIISLTLHYNIQKLL